MRHTFVVVLTLCLAFALWAGDKPSFVGSWEFSETKSTLDDMGRAFVQSKMKIEQTETDITITKFFQGPDGGEFEADEKLTLDGKECKSEAWGGSPRVTTATWTEAGDALKIVSSIKFERDGQEMVVDINEDWSLAEEGKTLSIKHTSSSDWGDRNLTLVFTKGE